MLGDEGEQFGGVYHVRVVSVPVPAVLRQKIFQSIGRQEGQEEEIIEGPNRTERQTVGCGESFGDMHKCVYGQRVLVCQRVWNARIVQCFGIGTLFDMMMPFHHNVGAFEYLWIST